VEQGKPEAEPKVVTEEGVKAEEVTPELRDVESTAKALEDVDKNAWGANNGLSDNFYTTDVDGYAIKKPITNASSVTIDGVDFHIAKIDGDWKVVEKKSGLEISTGKTSNTKNAAIEDATMRLKQNGGAENLPTLIDRAIQGFKDRNIKAVESLLSKEQTPAQEVEQLRAEEQAIEAVDYKGKKISDVKIGDVYYDYYAGAIRKFERLPNRKKENGEEVYSSKGVDENIFSEGSPDDVIGFNESDYLKSRPAETFLENAEDLFYKNPFLDFLEVFGADGKLVGYVALNKVDSDTVDVDNVVSMTGGQRKGGGSQIMKMVTKNADRTGVTLILVPEPLPRRAKEGFDTPEKLQAFYEKFGFVKDKKKPTMTRKPQPVLPQTIDEQIAELRIKEQVELRKYLKKYTFEEYLTDGKIDRDKITDAKDLKTFDEIYDKYDKLITPLLPKKEAPAPKQEAPAKAEPKLKPRVETRIKFAKAIELFNDISATKGGAKKRTLSAKRKLFLEQNPSIKYIDDNWRKISKQLEDKGLLKKEGNCP
jgi:GNAT superfamily N-acetyltransferase